MSTTYASRQASRVATRMKQERENRKWSQQELADRAGIDRKTVNRIERGHFSPSMETYFMLCQAMKVSATHFISDK
ncbi:MAG: helix-turn-helix domain-containing protein [Bacteroidota bacterium]